MKLTKVLRHARAIVAVLVVLVLCSSCGSTAASSPAPTYEAAILEGRTSSQAAVDGGASAVTIALVDAHRVLWSQAFGLANRETGKAPVATTMFGIGSVSKIVTAVALMKLVDRGVVDLDKPLVTYLPAFRMASPGYERITPRMLLNHSSGLPGSDYRNIVTRKAPVPGYQAQVLETLQTARLKAPPGYMSVYCNDGFTVLAALIEAMTGTSHAQFVQDEILGPLGMEKTRFPLGAFPAGSYAVGYANGTPKPQELINAFATGAIYSTPEDMGRLAMMFLGGGAVGETRILSAHAVAEMAVDQTVHSFNPIHSDAWAFGLGWDTVVEPGLRAVGFDGWAKGGDTGDYGAGFVVSPKAQLGVVVLAAGQGSSVALAIAERVLLRALAETGAIASVPAALPAVASPAAPVPDGLLASIAGEYATGTLVLQLEAQPDGALQAWRLSDTGRTPAGPSMKYRADGWFASDEAPLRAFKVVDADLLGQPAQYLVLRAPGAAYGHYVDSTILAQRVRKKPAELSPAWKNRLASTWLVVNAHSDELGWGGLDPRLRLSAVPDLNGLLAVRAPADTPAAGQPDTRLRLVDPSASDTTAASMLVVPQLSGRDLEELTLETRDFAEWARLGSYVHRPLEAVPLLESGSTVLSIGAQGYAEWRAVTRGAAPVTITITTPGAWQLYDASFTSLARGEGNAAPSLPAGSGLGYLTLFGTPGQPFTVVVQ